MSSRRHVVVGTLLLLAAVAAGAGGLQDFTQGEMANGLKDSLRQGVSAAIDKLGVKDGFLANPRVKIPLPDALKKSEKLMRTFGMGKQADELVTSMNRAAEKAVPQARDLMVDAVQKMSLEDAQKILKGGNDSATQYFRTSTQDELHKRFLPIVKEVTDQVGLAKKYDALAGSAKKFKLIGDDQSSVEEYVTHKSLDGLFLMMADEEKKIRANPVKATTDLAKRLFDAIR
jgi:Protein of unknown function (DUF4197)